jgi:hypothetical protein
MRHLKKVLPFSHKVHVRRVKLPKTIDGDCDFSNNKFTIRIERTLSELYAIEVLLHEMGHVLAWERDEDEHGPCWGKSYSLVYRNFLEWNENYDL